MIFNRFQALDIMKICDKVPQCSHGVKGILFIFVNVLSFWFLILFSMDNEHLTFIAHAKACSKWHKIPFWLEIFDNEVLIFQDTKFDFYICYYIYKICCHRLVHLVLLWRREPVITDVHFVSKERPDTIENEQYFGVSNINYVVHVHKYRLLYWRALLLFYYCVDRIFHIAMFL